MKYEKLPLSPEEKQIVTELLEIAGGMGCPKDLKALNNQHREAAQILAKKGYVTLTKKWFMVVLPAD